jgi:hypothetical protein
VNNMNKNLIYPHILACREYVDDPHWKDIIDSCACNKFPKGAKYDHSKRTLYIRYDFSGKPKGTSFVLSDDPEKLCSILLYTFRELLGLRSCTDVTNSKLQLEKVRRKNNIILDCTWKELKPRSVRNYILLNFASQQILSHPELSATHKDKVKNMKKLYRLIQLGLQFKLIAADDINYIDGKIESISGLTYNRPVDKLPNTSQRKGKKYVKKISVVESPPKNIDNFFVLTNNQGPLPKTDNIIKHKGKTEHVTKALDRWVKGYAANFILI